MIEKQKKRLSEGEKCVKGVGSPEVGEEKAYCGLVASNVRRLDSTQTFTTPPLRRLNIPKQQDTTTPSAYIALGYIAKFDQDDRRLTKGIKYVL